MSKQAKSERKVIAQYHKRKIEQEKSTKKQVLMLCQKDEQGNVLKSQINTQNYEMLRDLVRELDVKMAKEKDFSYRQYCKLFDAYVTKERSCGGKICCQAITEDGKKCKRPASDYASVDLTEMDISPSIPSIVKQNMNAKKLEELKLMGFAQSCCFYCSQHAALYLTDKLTLAHNLPYYLSHMDQLIGIFFHDVKAKKAFGGITYSIHQVGKLKTPDEVIKQMFAIQADMQGPLSISQMGLNWYYFGIKMMVYFYDTIKPYIIKVLEGTKEEKEVVSDTLVLVAAQVLLEMEEKASLI